MDQLVATTSNYAQITPQGLPSIRPGNADKVFGRGGADRKTSTSTAIALSTGNLTVNGTLNATLPAGSSNYIQNTASQQASSNFNISGNGIVGGNVGIGTAAPSQKLQVVGNGLFSGNVGIGTTAPANSLTIGVPETTVVNGRLGIFSPIGTNLIIRETTADVEGIMGVNSSNGVIYRIDDESQCQYPHKQHDPDHHRYRRKCRRRDEQSHSQARRRR